MILFVIDFPDFFYISSFCQFFLSLFCYSFSRLLSWMSSLFIFNLCVFPINVFKGICSPLSVALIVPHRFWYIVFLLGGCVYVTWPSLSLHFRFVTKCPPRSLNMPLNDFPLLLTYCGNGANLFFKEHHFLRNL